MFTKRMRKNRNTQFECIEDKEYMSKRNRLLLETPVDESLLISEEDCQVASSSNIEIQVKDESSDNIFKKKVEEILKEDNKDNDKEKDNDSNKEETSESKLDISEDNEVKEESIEELDIEVNLPKKRRVRNIPKDKNKARKIANLKIRTVDLRSKRIRKIIEIEKKVCESVKEFSKTEQAKKALNLSVIACSTVFGLNFIDKVTRKISLDVNAQEVSWNMNKNLNSSNFEYELYRNGKLLTKTRACKFMEDISIDKDAPDKVSSIRLNKDEHVFTFTWKAPEDNGTKLEYKVKATNKGFGKSYDSEKLKTDVISGVEKYIILLDGKRYESFTPSFNMNINSLQCGSHNLKVAAVDYAGNESKYKNINFKVDNTRFYIDNFKFAVNNPDITNDDYNFVLVREIEVEKGDKTVIEKKETPIALGDNLTPYFKNNVVPPISNPRYIYENGMLNITWEANTFGKNNTEFYIECKSKKGIKSYKSEKMEYTSGDFMPGYYYQINKEPLYTVKQTDSYTMDNNVNLDYNRFDSSKRYYFHVASANEFGNLSKTKTLEVDSKNFTSVGDKKDSVREILYRTKGLDSDVFRKITDDLYNSLTHSTIKKLKEIDLKIVVMQDDISKYALDNHNIKVKNKNIAYIEKDNTIIYNAKTELSQLIKEVIRSLDITKSNPISENVDFVTIYNEEKKNVGNGELNAQNYLVESVYLYMNDEHMLKSSAPKTYEFIKSNYNKIMFA